MARRTKLYKVNEPASRDHGKVYLLTEMSATQAELWAARAFLAMANGGMELPDELPDSGMAGLAHLGLSLISKLPFHEAAPLMVEMMTCVTAVPDPANPTFTRPLVEDDIEEVTTRLKLRGEILKLHSDFFQRADRSDSRSTDKKSPG